MKRILSILFLLISIYVQSQDVQVSVFNYPGLNGSPGSCSNENENLIEIIGAISGYTVDGSIASFANSTLLASQLDVSTFFFMTDMENQDPLNETFFPSASASVFEDWVNNGGVMVMTATYGDDDSDFLNKIFSWDLTTVSGSSWTKNTTNTVNTPFDDVTASTLPNLSATDAVSKNSVSNFTAMWGTDDNATVAVIQYGSGYVIFMGFDFYNTGIGCAQNSSDWVQQIIPAALEYATALSSGAVENITYTSADYTYSFSEDGTMYYVLVPGGSTVPTAEQIKAGVDYSGVTVIDNGSSSVTADIDLVINFSGLTADTNYDIYAVTEYNDGSSDVFSSINNANFTTLEIIGDPFGPYLSGKSIEVFLNEDGEYTLTNDDINAMVDSVSDYSTDVEDILIGGYPIDFNCIHVLPEVSDAPVVQLVATDLDGNKTKVWVPIIVSDTLAPEFSPIPDVEVEIEEGNCDSVVTITYPEIIASDNCEFTLEQIAGLGPDGSFPIGSTTETWVATDKSGNTDTLTFMVKVTLANAAPTIDEIVNVEVDEDSGPVVIEVSGISYGNDCLEQEIMLSADIDSVLVDSVSASYNSGDSTGTVSFYLAPEMFGDTLLSVIVRDGWGGTKTEFFRLTVNPVNDAPFLVTPLPDQVIHASYVLKIPISNSLGEIFDDIDDDELSIEIMEEGTTGLPAWATMSGDTLVCEPMIENTGYYNIVVMATDTSGATAVDTFEIYVDGYPTAIGDIGMEVFEVQLYPNPTKGNVLIEFSSGIHEVELSVMDITGKLVLNQQYSSVEKIEFDMSDKQPGMYFVRMNIDGFKITKKLIVVNQ